MLKLQVSFSVLNRVALKHSLLNFKWKSKMEGRTIMPSKDSCLNCLILSFLLGLTLIPINNFAEENEQPKLGTAPLFDLATLQGETISLSNLRGKFVVIYFAASWWPFCNAEAPHLEALWQKYKSCNVQVLIIDVKESKELASRWAKARKITFPVLSDSNGKISASYAPPDVLPDLARDEICIASNLIIDPAGEIQFFSLLDSKNFDAKLIALTKRLEELLLKNASE